MTETVKVGHHRYPIRAAQSEAFMRQREAVVLEDSRPDMAKDGEDVRDALIAALPDWAVLDLITTAERLAARARDLRPEVTSNMIDGSSYDAPTQRDRQDRSTP